MLRRTFPFLLFLQSLTVFLLQAPLLSRCFVLGPPPPLRLSTRRWVFERMSEECIAALLTAQKQTALLNLPQVPPTAMIAGCVDHPDSRALETTLQKYGITYRNTVAALKEYHSTDSPDNDASSSNKGWLAGWKSAVADDNDRPFAPKLRHCLTQAGKLADAAQSSTIATHHVFLALLGYQPKGPAAEPVQDVWNVLQIIMSSSNNNSSTALEMCQFLLDRIDDASQAGGPELVTGSGSTMMKTPTLAQVGTDLTQQASLGLLDPVYGRETEIRACLRTLLRRRKNCVCLIGDPGVGKTAIAEGVAQILVDEQLCPTKLRGYRLVSLELSLLVAGTKYRGEFEERLQAIIQEVTNPKAPPTILFLDEIHNLVGAGAAEGGMDAANMLKPALARGSIQLIGATTVAEYRKHIEKDAALERRLAPVLVKECTVPQTISILEAVQPNYERFHGVKYTPDALQAAATLSERYINDRFLPDKALDLLDESGAIAQLDKTTKSGVPIVTEHIMAELISEMTGIPIGQLKESELDKLRALELDMERRVKGQRRAVHAVARAIRRARSGLRDPRRPVASFLLSGPTGVGKTELCKTLADTYFGSEKDLIRIDMSEYMQSFSVSRLTGPPPGYIGYEAGGQLTEAVRRSPHSVVLLDEIEKAHEDVLNILLQIMEDGVLTDGKGRTVSFKNTIIVMTSNIGSKRILELSKRLGIDEGDSDGETKVNGRSGLTAVRASVKKSLSEPSSGSRDQYSELSQVVKEELESSMKPELLNRIDEIVVFSPLTAVDLNEIARLVINRITDRAQKEHELIVTVGDSVMLEIVREGSTHADQYGARPMRRAALRYVEDSISDGLIQSFLQKGDTVKMEIADDFTGKSNPLIELTRKRDGQTLLVQVEENQGGIDGLSSSKVVLTTTNDLSASATSR